MTRTQDEYPFDRNARAVIWRIGTVAAVGTSTVDVDVPGGSRLLGVPVMFTPTVGTKVAVSLDRGNALAVGPVTGGGAPVWTPTTGMKVFQARQTVPQSLPSATMYSPIVWSTVEDPYVSWSSGAPTRFKPTFAGNFLLGGGIGYASTAPELYNSGGNRRIATWFRNGAALASADIPNPPLNPVVVAARPFLVALNGTTDYVELAAWHNAAAAIDTAVNGEHASSITVTYAGP